MDLGLKNKTALVLAGGGGLGRAIAKALGGRRCKRSGGRDRREIHRRHRGRIGSHRRQKHRPALGPLRPVSDRWPHLKD